jgi:hypothetical protein
MTKSPLGRTRAQTEGKHSMLGEHPERINHREEGAKRSPMVRRRGSNKTGCAPTANSNTRRCRSVSPELDDRVACTKSPTSSRCIAVPEPRKCEYYQAAKSPRCRLTKSKEHDSLCTVKANGRCGLATTSRRKPHSPKPRSPKPHSPKPHSPKPHSPKPRSPKPRSPKPRSPAETTTDAPPLVIAETVASPVPVVSEPTPEQRAMEGGYVLY